MSQVNNAQNTQNEGEKKKQEREELQKWLKEIWGAELESLAPVETDEKYNKEG